MDETALGFIRVRHRSGIVGRYLDEIAKHIVMLDLQRLDTGFFDIIGLQTGDHPA